MEKLNLNNLIAYFRDCYKSDNREQAIFDFLDTKIENKILLDGEEELLNNAHPKIPIDEKKGAEILKKIKLFEKEKELIYGSFFILGKYEDFKGEIKSLCAPLLYYHAAIEHYDDYYFITIDSTNCIINIPLVNQLLDENVDRNQLEKALIAIPNGSIVFEQLHLIIDLLKNYMSSVDYNHIYGYPKLAKSSDFKKRIKELFESSENITELYPKSIIGIVSKSSETRGVLNELESLISTNDFSKPLQHLFDNQLKPFVSSISSTFNFHLSEAQNTLLKSSLNQVLTVIIGPPGTGKSYTIASIAIEYLSQGKSVLIASRTDEAVDVNMQLFQKQLGSQLGVLRVGKRRKYTTPLNRFLKRLLTNANTEDYLFKYFNIKKLLTKNLEKTERQKSRKIKQLKQKKQIYKKLFEHKINNEIKRSSLLLKQDKKLIDKLYFNWISFSNKYIKSISFIHHKMNDIQEELVKTAKHLIHLQQINTIKSQLQTNYSQINNFSEVLKIKSSTEKMHLFKHINFDVILKTFPVWFCNLSELNDALPLKKELFDLVIIDESTQCDIASCLPLLQRGKKVVFAGDPAQLRHISFLSTSIQQVYKSKYNLDNIPYNYIDYRNKSILDISLLSLQSNHQVATLDEHYRSFPEIIAFSNAQFYDNAIRIMTAKPIVDSNALYFIECKGIRSSKGINQIEVDFMIKDIAELIDNEKYFNNTTATSIGILSPFRAQVDYISKIIIKNFSIESIEKHQIKIGTAYSFQGDERDNMYISFVLDDQSHHGSFYHLNKEDILNVSITRGRNKQYIYHSLSTESLNNNSLIAKYLNSTKALKNNYITLNDSDLINEVIHFISKINGVKYWIDYKIAGVDVDILLENNNKYFAIDLVGFPQQYSSSVGLVNYSSLQRAGIQVFIIQYTKWIYSQSAVKEQLLNSLEK